MTGVCYNRQMANTEKTASDLRFARIEESLAAIAEKQNITEEIIRQTAEERRKAAAEAAKRDAEAARRGEKIDRRMEDLNKQWGNFTNGEGRMMEDKCLAALRKVKSIGGIRIDEFFAGVRAANGQMEGEYDIVGLSVPTTVVVEVKRALRPEAVRDFAERRLPQFRRILKKYSQGREVVGAMMFQRALARKEVPTDEDEPIALALRAGLILLQLTAKNEIKQITKPPVKRER